MAKEMLGAKIAGRTMNRLEDYAEREEISKSEAADRMIKQGLDVEESDMRLVPVRSDGGTIIEKRLDEIGQQLSEVDQDLDQQLDIIDTEVGTIDERVEAVNERVQKTQTRLGWLFLWFSVFVVWGASVLTFGVPLFVSLSSGVLLVVWFAYLLLGIGGYTK